MPNVQDNGQNFLGAIYYVSSLYSNTWLHGIMKYKKIIFPPKKKLYLMQLLD